MSSGPRRRNFDLGERLVDRLRDLVSKYPKGLGLVKEFVQNADDAGATVLRVYYDPRTHPGRLSDPEMNITLGPALLFINDSTFTEDDLRHIQTISNSSKLRDAGRTGRFGHGFNTSYSVSDHPSLLTGDTIAWFDPHRRILDRTRNAYAWSTADAAAEWPAWVQTFAPAGIEAGVAFDGTVFRLPLRTRAEEVARSEITKEAFTRQDWEEILTQFKSVGPALIVFLRSVLEIELCEILPTGDVRLRARVRTTNGPAVRAARAPLRGLVKGTPAELIRSWLASPQDLPSAAFSHAFLIETDGEPAEAETWRVISEIASGRDLLLLKDARGLCDLDDKVLPWAGASYRMGISSPLPHAGFACFLPLPEAGSAPVWLHGWFAIDSSRRGIAHIADVDDLSKRRVQWNCLLMEHGVGPAWAKLMGQLERSPRTMTHPYDLWPKEAGSNLNRALLRGFYNAVKDMTVFRAQVDSAAWKARTEVWDIEQSWHARLAPALRAGGVWVTEPPLPQHVQSSLKTVDTAVRTLTPLAMRQSLQRVVAEGLNEYAVAQAPRPWLSRREWVLALAVYCASDGVENLEGLPLALLADERIRTFSKSDPVYVAQGADRRVLAPVPRRALHPELQTQVFRDRPVPAIGVMALDLAAAIAVASEVVSLGAPPSDWLVAMFELLEQAAAEPLTRWKILLKKVPLVPGTDGQCREMGASTTPLLAGNHGQPILRALVRLGVPLVNARGPLLTAIANFARRHHGFIQTVSPTVVAAVLSDHGQTEWIHLDALDDLTVRAPILDLLSSDGGGAVRAHGSALRHLPILPTLAGTRVAAQDNGVFAPGAFRPPAGIGGNISLLDPGPAQQWLSIGRALGVPTLDGEEFVLMCVLPSFEASSAAMRERLLIWLRDEYPIVEASLDLGRRQALRARIRATAILPTRGGGFAAPARVYHADAAEIDELLGPVAPRLDVSFFTTQRDLWDRLFSWLDLPQQPLAPDLHAALLSRMRAAEEEGADAVRGAVLRLAKHIDRRWGELSSYELSPGRTFGTALALLAWLPARRFGPEDGLAALSPPNRLFRASELAANRLRDLVASSLPVLDGKDFGDEMANALGLQTEARAQDVLMHLDRLRGMGASKSSKSNKGVRRSFVAVLHFLGSGRSDVGAALEPWLRARSFEHIVLVRHRWYPASRVFMDQLRVRPPDTMCVPEDRELASPLAADARARAGLEHLGVRMRPSPEDWVALLEDLAKRYGVDPLPPESLKLARAALCELGTEEAEWLTQRRVWAPMVGGWLIPAKAAYLHDDPRLRGEMPRRVEIVENIQEVLDVARRAGARSLRASLRDQLSPEQTIESNRSEHRWWRGVHEMRVRSRPFHESMCRVAYEAASMEGKRDPAAHLDRDRIDHARLLHVRVAETLRVQSYLVDEDVVVFEHEPSSFLDESSQTVWVRGGAAARMLDELVRAVCKLCGVGDTLLVRRLLDAEPSLMQRILDDENIARMPTGRELQETDLPSRDPEDIVQGTEPEDGEDATEEVAANGLGNHADYPTGADDDERAAPHVDELAEFAARGAATVGGEPRHTRAARSTCSGEDANFNDPPQVGVRRMPWISPLDGWRRGIPPAQDESRRMGHGSSNPWDPNAPLRPREQRADGFRPGSHAHYAPRDDYDTGAAAAAPSPELHIAALELARAWEAQHGRIEESTATGALDGFDFTSGAGEERRIVSVRGLDGPWTGRGVGLTRREIDAGRREGDRWWLYVVEHALDPERASLHAIRNPLDAAVELRLDDGWRTVAEGALAPDARPVVGETVVLEDGRLAVIEEVEGTEGLFEVVLELADGETVSRVWRPSWRRT